MCNDHRFTAALLTHNYHPASVVEEREEESLLFLCPISLVPLIQISAFVTINPYFLVRSSKSIQMLLLASNGQPTWIEMPWVDFITSTQSPDVHSYCICGSHISSLNKSLARNLLTNVIKFRWARIWRWNIVSFQIESQWQLATLWEEGRGVGSFEFNQQIYIIFVNHSESYRCFYIVFNSRP